VPNAGESLIRTGTHTLELTTTPTKNHINLLTARNPPSSSNATITTTSAGAQESTNPVATNKGRAETGTQQQKSPNIDRTTDRTEVPKSDHQPLEILSTIRLSEIFPNTHGKDATDEFVELENFGDRDMDLAGWILSDASGKEYVFPKNEHISAQTFRAFYRPQTQLSLNNLGDTVRLHSPNGAVVDSQSYENTQPSRSFVLIGSVWRWSGNPSPHEPNRLPTYSPPLANKRPVAKSTAVSTVKKRKTKPVAASLKTTQRPLTQTQTTPKEQTTGWLKHRETPVAASLMILMFLALVALKIRPIIYERLHLSNGK
jgi:hypothetical protein